MHLLLVRSATVCRVQIYDLIAYDERLRMVPSDREKLATAVAEVRHGGDIRSLRAAGVGLLALGEYGEAFEYLYRALDAAETDRQTIDVLINLGDVHRYSDDQPGAEECYEAALDLARRSEPELVAPIEAALGTLQTA